MEIKNIAIYLSIILLAFSCGQKQNPSNQPAFYLDIIDVLQGPSEYDDTVGRFNRVLINSFDGRLNIIIERIETDDEGLNKALDKRIVINNQFFERESIYSVDSMSWESVDVLIISLKGDCFKLNVMPEDVEVVKLECKN